MFVCSVVAYVLSKKHFLLMLFCLEFMVLALFLFLFFYFYWFNYEFFFSSYFLSVTVCESVLGLSLLVFAIRMHGSDYLILIDSLW
uniref:NADH-ubiquinone oxidoreductase chain 4L n=1 Tax=Hypothenemus sp. BMNH 1039837 TaxID=1903764 RepID=A0A343A5N1_9CUCU|nr:NADH dehydrogenase subunit 4L [Hypothenemus sp. BMNH 1039837]